MRGAAPKRHGEMRCSIQKGSEEPRPATAGDGSLAGGRSKASCGAGEETSGEDAAAEAARGGALALPAPKALGERRNSCQNGRAVRSRSRPREPREEGRISDSTGAERGSVPERRVPDAGRPTADPAASDTAESCWSGKGSWMGRDRDPRANDVEIDASTAVSSSPEGQDGGWAATAPLENDSGGRRYWHHQPAGELPVESILDNEKRERERDVIE